MSDKKLLKYYYENCKKYEDEEFKFLIYPNVNKYRYVISNYGRIFSFIKNKEKKNHYDKDGYIMTSIITNDKKPKTIGMHRLVAYTFVKEHPENCNLVNHLDGNKTNNHYTNLEWTTPKGNTQHAIRTGLQINSGPFCPSAVYDEDTIHTICKMLENNKDVSEIYKSFFPNHTKIEDRAFYALIFSIKSGKRHKEISINYNIPKIVKSKQKPQFSKKETEKIKKMLLEGYSSIEIIKEFGGKNTKTQPGKRIYDKLKIIKKTLD